MLVTNRARATQSTGCFYFIMQDGLKMCSFQPLTGAEHKNKTTKGKPPRKGTV